MPTDSRNDFLNLRRQLRRQALQQRQQLTYFQQKKAARAVCHQIRKLPVYQRARHVAFYLSSPAELSTQYLLQMAWRHGKHCYVPVLHPWKLHHMIFVRYKPGQQLTRNRWGINEPALGSAHIKPGQLDLVLMPLVAFDLEGRRLGMGKGFYDRAFAFRRNNNARPVLLGLAHELQRISGSLPVSDWDVDMDIVATPSRVYSFS